MTRAKVPKTEKWDLSFCGMFFESNSKDAKDPQAQNCAAKATSMGDAVAVGLRSCGTQSWQ